MNINEMAKIRASFCARRGASSLEAQQTAAQAACQLLSYSSLLTPMQRVALYHPVRGEINPLSIKAPQLYMPILHPKGKPTLWFGHYEQDKMVINRLCIPEPNWQQVDILMPWQLDAVVLPLVAFDPACNRLGMGAGFYDRSFAFRQNAHQKKPILIGLAYDWQCVASISTQAWDVVLDYIVTDRQIYQRG